MMAFSRPLSIKFLLGSGRRAACLGVLLVCACSAGGPPFRDDPAAPAAPFGGRFAFSPTGLYRSMQLGELLLEPIPRDPDHTEFRMRVVGRDRHEAIRMRSYRGRAVMRGGLLELRAERCYEFGKRAWEGRLVPQERWDCEHLIFSFASPNGFRSRSVLAWQDAPRSRYSGWLGRFELRPMPTADGRPLRREPDRSVDPYFVGQIMGTLSNSRVVVWGYRAGYRVRRGDVLEVLPGGGGPAGRLRVLSHPEGFLITRVLESPEGQSFRRAQVAVYRPWPKSDGLFSARDEPQRLPAARQPGEFIRPVQRTGPDSERLLQQPVRIGRERLQILRRHTTL